MYRMHETIVVFFSSNFTIFGQKCFEMFGKGKNYKSPSEIRTNNLKIRGERFNPLRCAVSQKFCKRKSL